MVNRFLEAFWQTRVHNRKFSYAHVETGNILGKPSANDSIVVAHRVFSLEPSSPILFYPKSPGVTDQPASRHIADEFRQPNK